jgi:hypothetical protein
MRTLIDRGLVRPGGGKAFEGVVVFDLRKLAEWARRWGPRTGDRDRHQLRLVWSAGRSAREGGRGRHRPGRYCQTCKLQ